MKNLKLLKTGGRPAPGELVLVQGFVNTLDIEAGVDEIGTKELLKAWLVRHGLLHSKAKVSFQDFNTVLTFREALRQLLLVNNRQALQPATLAELNRLVSQYPLMVHFRRDGTPQFSSASSGVAGVLAQILAQVVKAAAWGNWSRLKACNEVRCHWVFYDSSKNRSGRWCSMSVCGSRDKARAYRRRHSGR